MTIPDRLLHVFHWPGGHPIRLMLPAMILVSLALHAAGFYLVRAQQPPRAGALPPLPARITVLPGGATGPGGAKSVLLAASDPAWMQPGRYRDRLLPPPRPGRALRALEPDLPPLLAAPPAPPARGWLPALPPLAARPLPGEPAVQPPPPAFAPLAVRFDPPGPAVPPDLIESLHSAMPDPPPDRPLELLVVLDAAGEPRHAWLLRGCGVPGFDLAAQRAVQRARFGATGKDYRGSLRIVPGPADAPPSP